MCRYLWHYLPVSLRVWFYTLIIDSLTNTWRAMAGCVYAPYSMGCTQHAKGSKLRWLITYRNRGKTNGTLYIRSSACRFLNSLILYSILLLLLVYEKRKGMSGISSLVDTARTGITRRSPLKRKH